MQYCLQLVDKITISMWMRAKSAIFELAKTKDAIDVHRCRGVRVLESLLFYSKGSDRGGQKTRTFACSSEPRPLGDRELEPERDEADSGRAVGVVGAEAAAKPVSVSVCVPASDSSTQPPESARFSRVRRRSTSSSSASFASVCQVPRTPRAVRRVRVGVLSVYCMCLLLDSFTNVSTCIVSCLRVRFTDSIVRILHVDSNVQMLVVSYI